MSSWSSGACVSNAENAPSSLGEVTKGVEMGDASSDRCDHCSHLEIEDRIRKEERITEKGAPPTIFPSGSGFTTPYTQTLDSVVSINAL